MENVAYLDTHLVVWLYIGRTDLIPKKIKQLINNNHLLISPIVTLELEYLFEIKRLTHNSEKIFTSLHSEIGLQTCQKDFNSVVVKARKFKWTCEPFDRIITAQASLDNSLLLTKDNSIITNYKHAIWN